MAKIKPYAIKIIKTCNLYLAFIVLGLCYAIPGPTLLDLTHLVSTDISTIVYIYLVRSAGSLIGSILAGVTFEKIPSQQLNLTIISLINAISMFGIPWSRTIMTLTIWMAINGLSLGAINNGANVCCLNLWGIDGASFYQALHFSVGIGGWIAPLIATPFLGNFSTSLESKNITNLFFNQTMLQPMTKMKFQNESLTESLTIPTVTYPFTIIGAFSACVTVLFFIMYIVSPIDENNQKKETTTTDRESKSLMIILVFFITVLVYTSTGTEIGYTQFLTSYSVKGPLHLTKQTGSYMTSLYWGSFMVARFACIFLTIKFSNLTMLVGDMILTTIGSLVLLFLAAHNDWALWLSSVLLGVGIASFFPSSVSWLGQYIPVTNKIASVINIGFTLGEMTIPYSISQYIDKKPEAFVYVIVVTNAVAILTTGAMYVKVRKLPDKHTVKEGVTNTAYATDKF